MPSTTRALSPIVLSLLLAACGSGSNEEEDGISPPDRSSAGDGGASDANEVPVATAACPDGINTGASSLTFDGEKSYVTMGDAKALGLGTFTVEAWVKREGKGKTFNTGVGGLNLVPIAGKGRGEGDGSNIDCNYAFGFVGDVLGADFEDMADGGNHPVSGRTRIPLGEWHHVAASYDGKSWRLYVDGVLDAESAANAEPRKDSIQHFGIGSAFNSQGVAAGFFQGAIDEVRVWGRARSAAELTAGMYERVTAGEGLVGRWALDEGDGAADTVGSSNGTITNASYVADGAALEKGLPPEVTRELPLSGTEVTGGNVDLTVAIADPDSQAFTATFHVRQITEQDDFTIVVLPDTQYYTRDGDDPKYFYDQTKWIMDNAEAYNIVGVIHNGDIVDRGAVDAQWKIADRAMKTLETKTAALPEGMPYGTGAGNHDQSPNGTIGGLEMYNRYFGTARFAGRSYFGGTYASGKADENWVTFSAGGLDVVVVNLQYGEEAREKPVLDWTRTIMQQHPDALGIVNSHYILTGKGNFSAAGKSIYEAMKDVDNVQILTCGHVGAEQVRTDKTGTHPIHSMLADYQFRANGGGGSLRIWEFSPANDEVTVRTYSPTAKKFETDEDSEFTLKVDLAGAGSAFRELAKVDPAKGEAKATLSGLMPKQTYEWYVTVTDCGHTRTSPLYRFKTN